MARPVKQTKKEETGDTASYFQSTDDGGIKCVSAALSIDANTHVIISAPSLAELTRAWFELCTKSKPLDPTKTVQCLYRNSSEPVVEPPVPKVEPLVWLFHPESDCAFVGTLNELSMDGNLVELGDCLQQTVVECKTILRKIGWPRSDIEAIEINTITKDDIPF
jgi:hypothetical protein